MSGPYDVETKLYVELAKLGVHIERLENRHLSCKVLEDLLRGLQMCHDRQRKRNIESGSITIQNDAFNDTNGLTVFQCGNCQHGFVDYGSNPIISCPLCREVVKGK